MRLDTLKTFLVPALLGGAFLTLSACGGSSSGPQASHGKSGPAPAPAAQPGGAGWSDGEESADSAGAPSPSSAERSAGSGGESDDRARESKRDSRPGLGTSWGESRRSRVSTAPFFRQSPDNPTTVAALFYNDREGVRAMSGRGFVSHDQSVVSKMRGGLTVRLVDSSGNPLQGVQAGGKTYVVGNHGQRYQIRITNHSGNRVEAVATVDGLDVIDGREGAFTKRGYIIAPFATVDIEGFRTSNDSVAAFRFGSVRNSYAGRKGKARNVGVIGVAFFEESGGWRWNREEVRRRHDADPFPGKFAEPPPGGGGWRR